MFWLSEMPLCKTEDLFPVFLLYVCVSSLLKNAILQLLRPLLFAVSEISLLPSVTLEFSLLFCFFF